MNILLTGASGFIGSHLLRALTARGHHVIACLRSPGRLPGVDAIPCDLANDLTETAWLPRLQGIDVVINAVGIIREQGDQRFDTLHRDGPVALFRAAQRAGVKKIIQISALGADSGAESRYHLSKRAADEALAQLDLDWIILRPSIVHGRGAQSTDMLRALAALPVTPLVGDGEQLVQPIHVDDLAEVVRQAVEVDHLARRTLDLVGPRAVTLHELLARQRQWLDGGAIRPLPIPPTLATGLARLGGLLDADAISPESVAMLQRGNHADVAPLQSACGFTPRSLDEALEAEPATTAERLHARLYFLAPLLRLSLALMWIFTAITSAFLYPREESYALVAAVGVSEAIAPFALYGAAGFDLLLGLALLSRRYLVTAALIQVVLVLGYTLIITIALPEFWLHPFGPITKNIPLIVATLVLIQMERPK